MRKRRVVLVLLPLLAIGTTVWFGVSRTGRAPDPSASRKVASREVPSPAARRDPAQVATNAAARPCDRTVLTKLDLSRPPSELELVAAGNLGEPLTPTSPADPSALADPATRRRVEADNLAFGRAIQTWNEHRYGPAYDLFVRHLKDFPNSPWAAEARLHLGCFCENNARLAEAGEWFDEILSSVARNSPMWHKALLRRSILHLEQGALEESRTGFTTLRASDPDSRHKTYASYWLRELSLLEKEQTALRDCGQKALARIAEILDLPDAAADLRRMDAAGPHGFNGTELESAALLHGLDPRAVTAAGALDDLPLPFVAHYASKHFVTVESVSAESVVVHDTRAGGRATLPRHSFVREWSGFALVFADPPPGKAVFPVHDTAAATGGCCGLPRFPADLGEDPCACKNCGLPGWNVNMVNMNFHISDTPLWWDAPLGPSVYPTLHYNSQDSLGNTSPFGPRWSFSYDSWLLVTPAGWVLVDGQWIYNKTTVQVRDGDGRLETFTTDSQWYQTPFDAPPGDTRVLVQTDSTSYTLTHADGTVFHYAVPAEMWGSSWVPFLTSISDRHGNSLAITHNAAGATTHLTHSALAAPTNQWTFDYATINLAGGGTVSRVHTISDPFGRSATFSYSPDGCLSGQTDMGGLAYSYGYSSANGETLLSSITTPKGTTTIITEPADGFEGTVSEYEALISPEDIVAGHRAGYPPIGFTPMWNNYRIRVTNAAGHTEEYHYDGYSRTGHHRDPVQLAAFTAPSWQATISDYSLVEGRGRITGIQTPATSYSETGHDPINRLPTATTDNLGTTWRSYYQSGAARGQLEYIRLPKSGNQADTDYEIRFEWDTNGKDLKSVKRDLDGVEKTLASYTYHHAGDNCTSCTPRDLHTITDSTGRTLTCTWLANGLPDTITDSLTGDVVKFTYDANSRPEHVKVNNQIMATTAFDIEGRLRSTLSTSGYCTLYDYDGLNRLIREDHPDDSFIKHVWECCFISETSSGVTIGSEDRILQRTLYHHDPLGRVDRVTDTAGRVTRYAYDEAGRLTHLTDAADRTTEWVYDPDTGLLSNKIYPGGALGTSGTYETYGWTNGLLTSFINRRNQLTSYHFDSHGNLDETTTPDGVTGTWFDTWDRQEYVDHTPTGGTTQTHHLVHDLLGRLTTLDGPWANDTIGWEYLDSLRKVVRTTPGSVTTVSTGDAYGRLASVINPLGTFTNGYAGLSGKLLSVTHSGGFSTALTYYDETQRQALHTITSTLPGNTVIASHTYGYDDQGRIDSWQREAVLTNPSGPTRSHDWSLRHDFASQLTDVIETPVSSSSVQAAWHYVYDSAGNLTTSQHTPAANQPLSVTTRAHNGLNQITGLSGGGRTLIRGTLDEPGNVAIGRTGMGDSPAKMTGDTTFEAELDLPAGTNSISVTAQDPSGNKRTNTYQIQTATQTARTFSYDNDGNLTSDGERTYEWDSQSRLTKVTWATGVTTTFIYNGLGQRSTRIDSDGTNTVTRHYLFDGISLVDRRTGTDPDAAIDRRYYPQGEQRFDGTAWTAYHYCRDHLSSVREVVKSDGTLAARYDFDPYGKRLIQYEDSTFAAGGPCDSGFTGHITQPSPVAGQTELVLAHYRVCDPALGRWLSPDPLGEEAGTNLYQYAVASPLGQIDTDGREAVPVKGGAYIFVVKPADYFGLKDLAAVFKLLNGKYINHPKFTGQCATGAQAMTGHWGKDGWWRDAAPDSKRNWFQGQSVASGTVKSGTMIAKNWPDGKYGGSSGHCGIYKGKVGAVHKMFAQNNPQGTPLDEEDIDPSEYFVVKSRVPYDEDRTQCRTPEP